MRKLQLSCNLRFGCQTAPYTVHEGQHQWRCCTPLSQWGRLQPHPSCHLSLFFTHLLQPCLQAAAQDATHSAQVMTPGHVAGPTSNGGAHSHTPLLPSASSSDITSSHAYMLLYKRRGWQAPPHHQTGPAALPDRSVTCQPACMFCSIWLLTSLPDATHTCTDCKPTKAYVTCQSHVCILTFCT